MYSLDAFIFHPNSKICIRKCSLSCVILFCCSCEDVLKLNNFLSSFSSVLGVFNGVVGSERIDKSKQFDCYCVDGYQLPSTNFVALMSL